MSGVLIRECKPLLEACTLRLYSDNSFRVTGLPVHASARQIKRRISDLKLAAEMDDLAEEYSHAFTPDPLPSIDHIRSSGQRLQDIQRKFVDEFFWFWPLDWSSSASDQALMAIANGDAEKAEMIWKDEVNYSPDQKGGLLAKHNLAVLYHLRALEQEYTSLQDGSPLLPDQIEAIDVIWQASFDLWEDLVDHEPFWSIVSERVRDIDDASLTTGFVKRFRSTFPIAFDNINASFAASYASMGKHDRAAVHIRYMEQTHQGLDDTAQTLQQVTKPLHARIDHALQHALENLSEDPASGVDRAKQLQESAEEPLKTLESLLSPSHTEVIDTYDEIADAQHSCLIAYGNKTEDWSLCVEMLERVTTVAKSETLQNKIKASSEIAQKNADQAQLRELCWICKKNKSKDSTKLEIDLHKEEKADLSELLASLREPSQIRWKHLKVPVSRCPKCMMKHWLMGFWLIGAFVGGTIGGLLAPSPTGALIGMGIGVVGGLLLHIKIRIIPSRGYTFPEVKELRSQGWEKGHQPSRVEGTPWLWAMSSPVFIVLLVVVPVLSAVGFLVMTEGEIGQSSSTSRRQKSTTSSQRSSSYGSQSTSSSYSSSRSMLKQEIESEKLSAQLLEDRIKTMDSKITSLESRMNSYRVYNTDAYNENVPRFNRMINQRNELFDEYDQLTDSVNAKVRRYNSGR